MIITNKNRRELFQQQGYLHLRNLLDIAYDLTPVKGAYSVLVDQLIHLVLGADFDSRVPGYDAMDFPNRFASLVGVTNGTVFDHLDPALNIYESGYQRWQNSPSAQPTQLFSLLSSPRILDVVEELIGPEIWATPTYHINIKLGTSHLESMRRAASRGQTSEFSGAPIQASTSFTDNFQMGQTPWHMDSYPGLGDESDHSYITVWIPLTKADSSNAALTLLPKSHLDGYCEFPTHREHEAVVLQAQPGDVIFMDGKTFHSSTPNLSENSYRWAINARYIPTGHRCARRCLPGFVARSRTAPDTELHDPTLWSACWAAALEYLSRYELPLTHVFVLSKKQVERMDSRWRKLVPQPESWLRLNHHGSRRRAMRSTFLRSVLRVRNQIPAWLKIFHK